MEFNKSLFNDPTNPNRFPNCNDNCSSDCCSNETIKGSGATLYSSKNRGAENSGKNTTKQ